jgi:hypothetical protein
MASETGHRAAPGSGLRALGAQIERGGPLVEPAAFGRWHAVVMEARFSRGCAAAIRIFADGVQRFSANGATFAADPYFKISLYGRRDRMAGPLTVYVTPPSITMD